MDSIGWALCDLYSVQLSVTLTFGTPVPPMPCCDACFYFLEGLQLSGLSTWERSLQDDLQEGQPAAR